MKHTIGDTVYWVYSNTHYSKKIPCTMCFGKKFVTIILGDGSHQTAECEFCQRGLERPSGFATTWGVEVVVKSGQITGISTRSGTRYEVGHKSLSPSQIFATEGEAQAQQIIELKDATDRAEKWFRDSFETCKKKQLWSTGYHKSCIRDAERKILWHQMRLAMIKNPHAQPTEKREGSES